MMANPSAHEILGLSPGADEASVDSAYRALIKRYHPDRQGGDPARAAEINRAYHELRGGRTVHQPAHTSVAEALAARRTAHLQRQPRKSRAPQLLALAIALLALLYLKRHEAGIFLQDRWIEARQMIEPDMPIAADTGMRSRSDPFDQALHGEALSRTVAQAAALVRNGDEAALAEASRQCHQTLRADPTIEMLDRCAAFDDAVLELWHDQIGPEGPFGASAITARQMAAAGMLSNDFQAVEERLDRVRRHVQQLLAPPEAPAEQLPEPGNSEASDPAT